MPVETQPELGRQLLPACCCQPVSTGLPGRPGGVDDRPEPALPLLSWVQRAVAQTLCTKAAFDPAARSTLARIVQSVTTHLALQGNHAGAWRRAAIPAGAWGFRLDGCLYRAAVRKGVQLLRTVHRLFLGTASIGCLPRHTLDPARHRRPACCELFTSSSRRTIAIDVENRPLTRLGRAPTRGRCSRTVAYLSHIWRVGTPLCWNIRFLRYYSPGPQRLSGGRLWPVAAAPRAPSNSLVQGAAGEARQSERRPSARMFPTPTTAHGSTAQRPTAMSFSISMATR